MIVKIKMMLVALVTILMIAIAFASPSSSNDDLMLDYAAGCGSADYTKVAIIRIVDSPDNAAVDTTTVSLPTSNVSGKQEVRVVVYWCNIPYNVGMGPTSITNVKLNITNNAGQTITDYPVFNDSPLDVHGQHITNGHNHYTSIYKFTWDTGNLDNGTYKLTPTVNFQFNNTNKFKVGETVSVSVKRKISLEDMRIVVFTDALDIFDGSLVKTRFLSEYGINVYYVNKLIILPHYVGQLGVKDATVNPTVIDICASIDNPEDVNTITDLGTYYNNISTNNLLKYVDNTYFVIMRKSGNGDNMTVPAFNLPNSSDVVGGISDYIMINADYVNNFGGEESDIEFFEGVNNRPENLNYLIATGMVTHELSHALGLVKTNPVQSGHCQSSCITDQCIMHYSISIPYFDYFIALAIEAPNSTELHALAGKISEDEDNASKYFTIPIYYSSGNSVWCSGRFNEHVGDIKSTIIR